MGIFRAFFGRRGVVGFNGCFSWASSRDGGFKLLMIAACRGCTGFICLVADLLAGLLVAPLVLLVAPLVFRAPEGPAAVCAGGRRPAREPSAPRASLGASSRSPARPRHRPPAPRQVPPAPFTPVGLGVLACGLMRRLEARPGPAAHGRCSQALWALRRLLRRVRCRRLVCRHAQLARPGLGVGYYALSASGSRPVTSPCTLWW